MAPAGESPDALNDGIPGRPSDEGAVAGTEGSPALDPKQVFRAAVAEVRANVEGILKLEAASGELFYADEGIEMDAGGAWLASIWKPKGNMLGIACAHGMGDAWRVMVDPLKPVWPTRVLDWPSEDFDDELRDAVASIRL